MHDDIPTLRRILRQARVIAVVGLSAQWHRPSYFAAKYMQQHGYRVIPVNPRYQEILGERCFARLEDITEPVDIVDVFRQEADMPPIAASAAAVGAKCFWQQLGLKNLEAHSARGWARHGDGPRREDRTRAAVRRAALGWGQHQGHFGAATGLSPAAV